jgi:MFS family permease
MRSAALERRFIAYLVATATADAGYWIAWVAQGWLVVKLTNSPLWLGLVSASAQLPFLLFSLAGGRLADRFDRRLVVATCEAAIVVLALAIAALVAAGRISIAVLVPLVFAFGTIAALEHPVDRAWIYDLVRGADIGRAIALGSLEWAVARFAGPAIGGIAIATIGIAAGYAVAGLCAVPLVALALAVRTRNTSSDGSTAPREGAGTMRTIVAFSLFTACFTIGIAPYQSLLPEIAKNTYGADAAGYGAMAAAGGIGAIAGAIGLSILGGVARPDRAAILAAFTGAVLLFAFAHAHGTVVAVALLAAMGLVDTLMYAFANTYVQQIAGDDERGRANGVFSIAFLGGAPVGNALLGIVAGRFGSLTALSWSAAAVALCALCYAAARITRS